jgi:phosphoserine phosphatase
MSEGTIVYVDVDDTLVRSVGSKRIPIPAVVRYVRQLSDSGAVLYCWSSGGAEYAKSVASDLGIDKCFTGYLPKPTVLLDDQAPAEWRYCKLVRPLDV